MSETAERLGAEVGFGLDEVLAATRGELVRLGDRLHFPGVTTDTRAIRPGELFVAIRGDTHDGHRYLAEAARRGAGAVLSERAEAEEPLPCAVVAVRDTLAALGDLAAFHRRRHRARVLAVAGSNGKTTTKEMVAAILRHALGTEAVLHTRGTQNNLVGLPLTLLRLGDAHAVAVLELGMNGPGEVWRLAEIAEPDAGVITCVAPEHLEGVGLAARRRGGRGGALPPPASVRDRGRQRRRSPRGRGRGGLPRPRAPLRHRRSTSVPTSSSTSAWMAARSGSASDRSPCRCASRSRDATTSPTRSPPPPLTSLAGRRWPTSGMRWPASKGRACACRSSASPAA